jgi:FkbM family methyltransferase
MEKTSPALNRILRKHPFVQRVASSAYGGYLRLNYGREGMLRPVNGETFRINPRYRMRFPAIHDPHVAELLRSRTRPGMTCLNIGANVGIMTLQMARWSTPGGRVIAFEPNPFAREALFDHVQMNGFGSCVQLEPLALSNEISNAPMFVSGTDGMSRLGAANAELHGRTRIVRVQTTTLDSYCARHSISPDVIMMDIEGYEIEALEGARELVKSLPNLLIVAEFHPNVWKKTRAEVELLLTNLKLKAHPVNGGADIYTAHQAVYLERL